MSVGSGEEDWLYHLPEFLDTLREAGAQSVLDSFEFRLGGVLYHHRGVRMPGYDATFVIGDGTFELEIDAVGPRQAWAVFDADRRWDFYVSKAPGDAACLTWMTDGEFETEEAESFDSKTEAVGLGRFSFGIYLQPPADWEDLEARVRETSAPCFIYRPSGRMVVPEGPLSEYAKVVPPELLAGDETAPDQLGLVEAHVGGNTAESG